MKNFNFVSDWIDHSVITIISHNLIKIKFCPKSKNFAAVGWKFSEKKTEQLAPVSSKMDSIKQNVLYVASLK